MKSFLVQVFLATAILLFASAFGLAQTTWYIDITNTAGPWDGTQAHPFRSIQSGINAAVNGDTVLVMPGTYFSTIDYLGKPITVISSNGPDSTTIDGSHATYPDYGSVVKFYYCSSATTLEGFTLTGGKGTLENWTGYYYADYYYGGGIFAYHSSPTIKNCRIVGNSADYGGGVYFRDSSPKIINCIVSENHVPNFFHGCGMQTIGGAPKIINCIFSNNLGISTAILCSSDCTFINCTIAFNTTGIYLNPGADLVLKNTILWANGGYEIRSGSGSIISATYSLIMNGADEPWFGEGCIDSDPFFLNAGNQDFRIVNFSPCRNAGTNDAPSLPDTDLGGDPRILEGTVDIGADEFSTPHGASSTRHVPTGFPTIQAAIDAAFPMDTIIVAPDSVNGGPYVENIDFRRKTIILKSSEGPEATTIDGSNPSDPDRGSAIFIEGTGSMVRVEGFTIRNGTGTITGVFYDDRYGGGILCSYSRPTIKNNVFEGNSAQYGAGIFAVGRSLLRVTGCSFWENTAEYSGGGIAISASSLAASSCFFSCNSASTGAGTAASGASEEGWVPLTTLFQCTFLENSAESYGGGAYLGAPAYVNDCVFLKNSAEVIGGGLHGVDDLMVANCAFSENSAGTSGGGLSLDARYPHIVTGCIISGNRAGDSLSGRGGGIRCTNHWLNSDPNFIMNNTISGNEAAEGGGIYCEGLAKYFVQNNDIYQNTAFLRGGGLCCDSESAPVIFNNIFRENTCASDGGGIACGEESVLSLVNNTIIDNDCTAEGGGIFCEQNSNVTVTNTIIWGNSASAGPQIFESPSANLQVTYCDVQGGWPGSGNINALPLFLTGPLGDFYLSQVAAGQAVNSPCVDTGDPVSIIAGTTRTNGFLDMGIADMGYHYVEASVNFDTFPDSEGVDIPSGVLAGTLWTPWGVFIDAHSFNSRGIIGAFTGRPGDHYTVQDNIPISEPNFLKTCNGAGDPTSDAGIFTFTFVHPETEQPLCASYVSVYFLDLEEENYENPLNDSRLEAYDVEGELLDVVYVPLGPDGQQFLAEIYHPGIHFVKAFAGQPDPGGDSGSLDNFRFILETPIEEKSKESRAKVPSTQKQRLR